MALNAYLRLTGEVQGEIKGSVTQAGREDSILVIGFSDGVMAVPTEKKGIQRVHEDLVVTKEIDRATPLLLQAFGTGEVISSFRLDFWRPSASGQEVQYYTVELTNARISGIRQEMLNNKYPENMQHREREHVSFVYGKITWTWQDGGISSELAR